MTIEDGNVAQLIFAGWMFRSALAVFRRVSRPEHSSATLAWAFLLSAAVGIWMVWAGVAQ